MLPLSLRSPAAYVAGRGPCYLSTAALVSNVCQIAEHLPRHPHAINLCQDRLQFLHGLLSVVLAGQCNLLPPNRQSGTIGALAAQYPDCYILHDGFERDMGGLPMINLHELHQLRIDGTEPPNDTPATAFDPVTNALAVIDSAHPAAISFTSGSTGQSKPNLKTWSMLLEGAKINAANMLIDAPSGMNIVATVPGQHMYGLELTITLPLVADVRIHGGQPLFPEDVQSALQRISKPRALVSTPQHLRALVASQLSYPKVERIFSATAPLDATLARQVESVFTGEVTEIFGCSEMGSVARRRTATDSAWTPFTSMTFTNHAGTTHVSAPHVAEPVELQDQINLNTDGSFELKGRFGDLINVAGKRGSLAQLNQLLLSVPGVIDGVIFDPRSDSNAPPSARLAALVVGNNIDRKTILATLREHVDPVFLPRPIVFTDALPRSESSKLPRQAVLDAYKMIRRKTPKSS